MYYQDLYDSGFGDSRREASITAEMAVNVKCRKMGVYSGRPCKSKGDLIYK
jgi:hypothetical protein